LANNYKRQPLKNNLFNGNFCTIIQVLFFQKNINQKLNFLKFNYLKYINNKWDVQVEDAALVAVLAVGAAQEAAIN
jgi:hypothetical protein